MFGRLLVWMGLTALTAISSRWLSNALHSYPRTRAPGPSAACHPAASRDEQHLADSPLWPLAESLLVERALRPFKLRPTFKPLRILNLDHGPGGIAIALRRRAALDSTIVAADSVAGMDDLARHRAARRGATRPIQFLQSWTQGLPFHDHTFDLVITSGGFHSWPYPEQTLAEIARVLTPGGRYLVADFRRDLSLWQWLLVRLVQALFVPKDLRALGEPAVSIGAAYSPHEAEWLAARAKLPDLQVTRGPAWVMLERALERT